MNSKLETILGTFKVIMTYKPSADDDILLKMTNCINKSALPIITEGFSPDEAIQLIDEFQLEKDLFDSIRVNGGSAERLTLSLKEKVIAFQSF